VSEGIENEMGRACSTNGGDEECMHIGYWWESQKERDHWEDQDVGGWTILKMDLGEIGWDGRDGSNWLRIGTCGGLL
jgi:hypothetical protein